MSEIIETVPFNFNDLYKSLEDKFAEKGYDIEEGSNTSQLITAMAYLTSMLNVNTAVNINETILPLARKRKNALQDARMLGYETAHKQSYKYRFKLTPDRVGAFIVPKYSKFEYGEKSYYYMGNRLEIKDVTQQMVDDGYSFEVDVKEGTLHSYEDNEDTLSITTGYVEDKTGNTIPQYYIDIPFINVEESGLEVFLTYYNEYGMLYTKEIWYQSEQFMVDKDTVLNKEYIRLDNIDYKTPRIYFTLAGVGLGVRPNTKVDINVLSTSGSEGKITDETDFNGVTHGLSGISVTGIKLVLQGTDEETLQSIQTNAPLFHNSANRAITKTDYLAICNRHSTVNTSMVWGGDDEYPKSPGHVWFSFLPSTTQRSISAGDGFNNVFSLDNAEDIVNWFMEDNDIVSAETTVDGQLINPGVWDILNNYKIPTIEFHHRQPLYLDFEYDIDIVKYNIKTSKSDTHQEIFEIIDSFFTGKNTGDTQFEKFENEYFHSSLKKRIDTDLTDISGFNDTVRTKLMVTDKNISSELIDANQQDVFIPLAIPYEEYFDVNKFLKTGMLPNIDTEDFHGLDIYTDWSSNEGIDLKSQPVIISPILTDVTESQTMLGGETEVVLGTIEAYNSHESSLKVFVNDVEQVEDTDYTFSSSTQTITFTDVLSIDDVVNVVSSRVLGQYFLFNNYKKSITVQFYVDATNATNVGGTTDELSQYSDPKAYLTAVDSYYGYTNDDYYITTEGYALRIETDRNVYTGPVAQHMSYEYYQQTPLKREMFDTVDYLDFNYSSPNFKVIRNVIPRLKQVNFI